jgi:hypothetical protein
MTAAASLVLVLASVAVGLGIQVWLIRVAVRPLYAELIRIRVGVEDLLDAATLADDEDEVSPTPGG